MRARQLGRRLVGLLLFVALVLVTTPALAALKGTTATPSPQDISAGNWRLIFHSTTAPSADTTGKFVVSQSAGTLFYLVNTGLTAIPGSYSVTVQATSGNGNTNVTFTACVGATWTNNCVGGTTFQIGGTNAPNSFPVAKLRPSSAPALPAGTQGSVHIKVQNPGCLCLSGSNTATLSVTVSSR